MGRTSRQRPRTFGPMSDAILTSDTALADPWTIANAKRRKGSNVLKVPADALEALLRDHHTLITALRSRKLLTISLNPDQESLRS